MIAETVFNVFSALSESEKQRFYVMIGVNLPKLRKPNIKNFPSKTEITEQMAQVIESQARRNKEKVNRKK